MIEADTAVVINAVAVKLEDVRDFLKRRAWVERVRPLVCTDNAASARLHRGETDERRVALTLHPAAASSSCRCELSMQVVRIQRDVYSLKDFIQRHPNEITPCSVGNTSAVEVVDESVEAPKFEETRRIECNILKGLIKTGRR